MTAESDPQRAGLTNPAPRFSALLWMLPLPQRLHILLPCPGQVFRQSVVHSLKLIDQIYAKEELVASFPIVVSASIPRMVKPQLRP